MSEEPKRGRGRPRKYENSNDRQKAWKEATGFEKSEKRRKYKAEWAARKRKQQAEEQ